MDRIRLAAVEYINTLPFLYGISKSEQASLFEVVRVNPAECARQFGEGLVDVALVPVGALQDMPEHKIITNYCIGAFGPVDTVALLSDVPVDAIRNIIPDPHSKTSSRLVKLICEHYWKIYPDFEQADGKEQENTAYLYIGDKVKEKERYFKYKYDLAEEWTKWKNLPMVFAVWIADPSIDPDIVRSLNDSFKYAINHIKEVPLDNYDLLDYWRNYLVSSIRYELDESALKGLNTFRNLMKQHV